MPDNMTNQKKIPTYTKLGLVAVWAALLFIVALTVKNCANTIYYGNKTPRPTVEHYYRLGEENGRQGHGEIPPANSNLDNPILRKAYNQGYRNGLDQYQREQKEKQQ